MKRIGYKRVDRASLDIIPVMREISSRGRVKRWEYRERSNGRNIECSRWKEEEEEEEGETESEIKGKEGANKESKR